MISIRRSRATFIQWNQPNRLQSTMRRRRQPNSQQANRQNGLPKPQPGESYPMNTLRSNKSGIGKFIIPNEPTSAPGIVAASGYARKTVLPESAQAARKSSRGKMQRARQTADRDRWREHHFRGGCILPFCFHSRSFSCGNNSSALSRITCWPMRRASVSRSSPRSTFSARASVRQRRVNSVAP